MQTHLLPRSHLRDLLSDPFIAKMKFLTNILLVLSCVLVLAGTVQGQKMEEPERIDASVERDIERMMEEPEEMEKLMKEVERDMEPEERQMGRRRGYGGYGYGYGYPYYSGYGYGYPYYGYGYPGYYGYGHRFWGRHYW
ncbi:putative transmembrane protein [Toxoplasma gondii TgCatPRC2]|uniref:Transmembrane protein n=13 Tax=Toxoplasma gondii TaxID=5811 RepID=A0A125YYV5_TOXGV|nr:hypothetical protein TGGT1_281590 [Toxoplasma gondii GT1]ESS32867.1 putative transmembrane protein [Toxoplasma gondii VEG]KAF4643052.1 hypothetical protein TGRH88_037810 [Toxoplasma gondii]KFG28581.1 putative transmembrane protein [Toxoplasma gondii p89]KFG36517.1 putative transmembrane protein [Toxoplasma gondii FOU]KFG41264.1 putative transmembrane protein [Toxoplasma gondii GAB2-2007-GAL-DOM2]KFG57420.1 putative transmembrane protein [Toxoplasma gondii RUB]KFH00215.1 putative transmemb